MRLKNEQYKSRPKIEKFISEGEFDNEIKTSILDFASHLRANKMSPQWASVNTWKFLYKGKRIGYIRLIEADWYLGYIIKSDDVKFDNYAEIENLSELICNNFNYCDNCAPTGHCAPGQDIKFMNGNFKNVCWNDNLRFKIQNSFELERIKKLYEYSVKSIE